jgi:hypothetical protein
MKKLPAIGLGAALTAAILTTSPQPAKADPALVILGGIAIVAVIAAGAHHPTLQTVPPWSWAHTHWCQSHYKTYNPRTNLYFHKPGQQRHCVSR